jgi:UDP-glucose 4-epimerase
LNILVTGGAGFLGSHIADEYIGLGHNVTIIDNMSTGTEEYINPKAMFYKADIRDKGIGKIIKENKIEVINHHAAQINLRNSVLDPQNDADINILGSINLLQSSLEAGVKKVIFASSGGAIYGEDDKLPVTEEHSVNPRSPYGINKLAVEKYLYYYKAVHGLDYTVLRYANAYGPRQNAHGESGVVAIFASKLLKNEEAVINGDGRQSRDYVYISDIVKANILALGVTKFYIYNIGTGKETSVNYIFNKLNEFAGTSFKEVHGPSKAGEQLRSALSYERINNEFGWKPETDIDTGLKQTFEFFNNRNRKRIK